MNTVEYATMAERERSYWWHVGRLAIIDSWLKNWVKPKNNAKILNVGCGTGGTLPVLEKYGAVSNVDVSDEAIKFMKKSGYKVDKINGTKLPYKANTYDLVVAFDVLEHIEDHEKALNEWNRVLKKDGAILFTVPAYQWLWSDHDTSLHHFRRYSKNLIKSIVPQGGRIQRVSYYIVFSLPLVVGFRVLNKILGRKVDSETSYVNVPNSVNSLFSGILKAEAWAHRFIRFPAGTSLITIIRKN
jgi:SAM-dependent methyltransferase